MWNRYKAALILLVVSLAVLAPSAPAYEGRKMAETQKAYKDCLKDCDKAYEAAKKACDEKPKEERAECRRQAREANEACEGSCIG